MNEVKAKRRQLSDHTGVETDCDPMETRTRDNFTMAAKRRRLDDDTGDESGCDPVEMRQQDNFDRGFLAGMVCVDGDVFPRFPLQISPEEHVRSIRTMPMREDDVIILSFPNSGARWIWEMARMLITGSAEHDFRTKEHVTLELNSATDIDSLPSPRVLCSHLFPRQLSNDIVAQRSRVVHVMRNPKDLAVSYYFRCKQLSRFQDEGLNVFVEDFLNGTQRQGTCADYMTYMQEMMTWKRENPEVPILNVFYEDVYKNPVRSVQELSHFLQLGHVTDALCADIADQCAFRQLKVAHDDPGVKFRDHPSRILFRDYRPSLFRKGIVGDWKNHFTMALSEHFDAVLADKLHQYDVNFQFTAD
ncbi:sulfotransferase 1C2A-like [Babylonia areolata]|uniref:sulfotransferase 1C2A-like n=1 Tax=Babylonia areolata TaxID=304850 RepID=UPI003FD22B8E